MQRFTRLFCELDQTTRINEKVAALEAYFREVPPADAAWALQFLSGRIPARVVSSRHLWDWTVAETGFPHWLLEECQDAVGDFAENLALLFPEGGEGTRQSLSELVTTRLLPLRGMGDISKRQMLLQTWRELNSTQRLVWNKLITGEFRVGVSSTLVVRSMANVAGLEPAIMAHRVLGKWQPTAEDFTKLLSADTAADVTARPYPFFLASPIELKLAGGESIEDALGNISQWQAEWKWDGIRAQMIRRGGELLIWSRGDELATDTFPEIAEAGRHFPNGTVIDGEIVAWENGQVAPFSKLQRRLGRKNVTPAMREQFPVAFLSYDLLEQDGKDIRDLSLDKRRSLLEALVAATRERVPRNHPASESLTLSLFPSEMPDSNIAFPIQLSPLVQAASWSELAELRRGSRERGVEGLMLKRRSSPYGVGRVRGDWWKWKINPFVIDAVLIYAQRGSGRRASLFTDYTFGVWDNGELVPVAKAYSGLTDEEIRQVDAFVRHNSIDKHGPVRIVKPELVFELAFEGIQRSTRHRSGIAVRFPRMNLWRQDKKAAEADTLETLKSLIASVKT